jgi:tetratricopeptide (TPR) repeat protein
VLQEALVAADPDSARFRRELALTTNNLAMLLGRSPERLSAATALYQSAIDLFKTSAKAEPKHRQTQQFLATSYSNLASLHDRANPEVAEKSLHESVRILETLVAEEPQRVDFGRDLALSLNNLAALHSRLGEHAASAQAYQKASQIQHVLLDQTPHSQVYRRDLAVSENNIGLALARADSQVEAEKAFHRAIAFQYELVAERPDDLSDAASLAGIWNNLGMVQEYRDRLPEACDAYEKGIAILTDLSARSPDNLGVRQNLSRTYFNYSRTLLELDSADRAVEFALRRRNLWPGNPKRLLSVAQQLIVVADRVDSSKTTVKSRISRSACRRLISETLSAAIQAGLDPTVVRESNLSDWLVPLDVSQTQPSGKQIAFDADSTHANLAGSR